MKNLQWKVSKNRYGFLKRNSVLSLIFNVLGLIPEKPYFHMYIVHVKS